MSAVSARVVGVGAIQLILVYAIILVLRLTVYLNTIYREFSILFFYRATLESSNESLQAASRAPDHEDSGDGMGDTQLTLV